MSPASMTWNRCRSNAPSWKLSDSGYVYVPGPWSSPDGSVASSSDVPGTTDETTEIRAYAVALPLAAPMVRRLFPKPSATLRLNWPELSAVVDALTVAPPSSTAAAATETLAPGAVVPVTVAVVASSTVPSAGELTVSGSSAGGPWSTYRARTIAGCSTGLVTPAPTLRMSRAS